MKKVFRIKKNEEFSRIIALKHSLASSCFIVYFAPKAETNSRVGISVSKKLGKAYVRNKIKRQLRMMISELIDFDSVEYDYIVIVRPGYLKGSFEENKKDLENTLKKVRIKGNVKR